MEKRIGDALRQSWPELGSKLVSWLRAHSPVYRGDFKSSHKQKCRGTGLGTQLVVYSSDRLGRYKDKGRRAGKQPPPSAMLSYVKARGLTLAGSKSPILAQQKSIAFLIGRKIGRGNIGPKKPNLYPDKLLAANRSTISGGIKRLSAQIAAMLNR